MNDVGPPALHPTTRHGIDIAPPVSVASPHSVDAQPGEDVQWWTPSWADVVRHLGWRWLWFAPAVALAALFIVVVPLHPRTLQIFLSFWKPIVFAAVLPSMMAVQAMKTIVKHRTDPFCIHCGYSLEGLPDGHRCPECGRAFTLAMIEEYRRDPHWFAQRWKARHAIPQRDTPFAAGAKRSAPSSDGT